LLDLDLLEPTLEILSLGTTVSRSPSSSTNAMWSSGGEAGRLRALSDSITESSFLEQVLELFDSDASVRRLFLLEVLCRLASLLALD
jgi:hypothetical protein